MENLTGYFQLTRSSREFLLVVHMNLMQFMWNERNHGICYTITTYELHTLKNKNKIKSLRYIFGYIFCFISVYS